MGIEFKLLHSMDDISADAWDDLWQTRYPFVQHRFLAALEASACTSEDSGWQPQHLIGSVNGKPAFAMPLYLKQHSWGEYVFDWSWADAYRRHGLTYYPKLVNAIPFTPATGPRLAYTPDAPANAVAQAMAFLQTHCQQQGISGLHCLFTEQTLSERLTECQLQQRQGCQFHWFNREYSSFDDFLETFSSRKRKNLRKERQQVQTAQVSLRRLSGNDITDADWDAFYQFYHTTYLKRSGATGYLNRDFFQRLSQAMGEQLLMVMAYQQGQRIAAALCFFDDHCLYGRYWGCHREVPGLHFEACYYQGIEFAIERGLQRFDPGAQGEHKIQRGFEPILTFSNHWLTEPAFQQAIGPFLASEADAILDYQQQCRQSLPFKHTSQGP
ncbi:MAG: GNAT family N-acetyltransferase [Candidatus Pelagadaptatus aseana]|uniref:GNAT family N-acetyltransferase n=1 Tax=Candidatus Pelagadaptatus aseana TaxID=3120508 RepID=UPI0039B2C27A